MKQGTRRENPWEMKNRPDNDQGQIDRFTRGYPYTHTHLHVQPARVTTTIVKSSEQPHKGQYTFTRSSFTVAWRASAPPSSSTSSSSVSSSLSSSLCLRCSCFVAMLLIARQSCVRTCKAVLSNCPKIVIVSARWCHGQTTTNTTTR